MTKLTTGTDGVTTLSFDQGSKTTFHFDIYTDEEETTLADLSGYEARGSGRQQVGAADTYPTLFNMVCTVSGGRVSCKILPSVSSSMALYAGFFGVEAYNPNDAEDVHRVKQGKWIMSQEIVI